MNPTTKKSAKNKDAVTKLETGTNILGSFVAFIGMVLVTLAASAVAILIAKHLCLGFLSLI